MLERTVVSIAVLAIGCNVESEDSHGAGLGLDEETREIVQNLLDAGYPEEEIEVRRNGTVLAGGDAEVSLEASREMIGVITRGGEIWEPEEREFRQYRTSNTIGASIHTICVDGAAFAGTLSTALDNAIANYTNLSLWFDLVRTNGPGGVGCDATITANVVGGTGGISGFPSGGLPYYEINVGSGNTAYGLGVTTHVITHELGHTLGFRHSDYYNRSISCGGAATNEGGAGVGVILIPGTPLYAVNNGSVMNSCANGGSTGQWTASDVAALLTLYPAAPPPLPPPPPPSPNSCLQNNACGGQAPGGCWCDNACLHYADCCSDGPCAGGGVGIE